MEEKITAFSEFLDERVAACAQRADALRADGRTDEVTFEKVRGNIYDIFRTVLRVASEQCGTDGDALRRFFAERIEQIPASWRASLEKAESHADTAKAHLEQLKLDAVRDIEAHFARIWEDEV